MTVGQHIFILCEKQQPPFLTDMGWDFPEEYFLPLNVENMIEKLEKWCHKKESWSGDISVFIRNNVEVKVYFEDETYKKIESVSARVSIYPLGQGKPSGDKPREEIVQMAKDLKEISGEIELKIFDTGQRKFVNSVEEVIEAICESRSGKIYGCY